mmetsp:Transcript_40578/g.100772  ORF Transcript_40578/g.100772 Transcript_40578/m.100772 type:complete len:216 (-) Transcript_40578:1497-2144(-)
MNPSVSISTEAVASSSTRTRERLRSARPIQTSWRCPIDKFDPNSSIGRARPCGYSRTVDAIEHSSSTCHTASSLCSLKGSRFERRVPLKRTGSCGIIARRERSASRDIVEMSIPSIVIAPSLSSHKRKSATKMDDLPAPVRPTMPSFSPPAMSSSSPLSTGARSTRYAITTPRKRIAPFVGHESVTACFFLSVGSSAGNLEYSNSRSTLTICVSS